MNELLKCYLFLCSVDNIADTYFSRNEYDRIMFKCYQTVFIESSELYERRKVRIIQSGEIGLVLNVCYCGIPHSVKLIVTRNGYATSITEDIRNLELL